MKIAFWSNSRGSSGVTSNLACIAMQLYLSESKRILVFENHQNVNNLGNVFSGQPSNEIVKEQGVYQTDCSIENILLHMRDDTNTMMSNGKFINEKQLCYLPRSRNFNQEFLEFQLSQQLIPFLDYAEKTWDHICMDISPTEFLSSQAILREADLVVVSLAQNPRQWENFFRNYSSIQNKAFYILGYYNAKSIYSLNKFCTSYGIHPDRVGKIPYNINFSDAISRGMLIPFLQSKANQKFVTQVNETISKLELFGKRVLQERRHA